ncbi:hypothetical protein ABT324_23830 [Saccharopolyspora sp. NPDC000359]|uniref:hypothetical protein n=1 Tax=Saccharopolyspora sp. NPDC000359 TaxID=3154251 RepID=UPI003319E2A6
MGLIGLVLLGAVGYALGGWTVAALGAYCGAVVGMLIGEAVRGHRTAQLLARSHVHGPDLPLGMPHLGSPPKRAFLRATARGTIGLVVQAVGTVGGAVVGYAIANTVPGVVVGVFLGMAIGSLLGCVVGPVSALRAGGACLRHLAVGGVGWLTHQAWDNEFSVAVGIGCAVLTWALSFGAPAMLETGLGNRSLRR